MGLFDKFKKIMDQNNETDITKMEFVRYDGFVGSVPQNFVDKSLPMCPMCHKQKPWLLHISSKMTKMFPVAITEHTYHIKCDGCGLIMHTTAIERDNNMPHEVKSPSPRDNITVLTFDVLGSEAKDFELAGKQKSIWEVNQMAEK
ncbi:MAG: hypothetical protein J6S13_00020 [Clostridia bacterium]|nr:hypothetical protein [Clostridia bacterium]